MSKKLIILIGFIIFSGILNAQNNKLLKSAKISFNKAEKLYKEQNYNEASEYYETVVENAKFYNVENKYFVIYLESLSKLIDIYSNHLNNLPKACDCIKLFYDESDMIKYSEILKPKNIAKYSELLIKTENKKKQCIDFYGKKSDKSNFEKTFNEEIKNTKE